MTSLRDNIHAVVVILALVTIGVGSIVYSFLYGDWE